MSKRSSTDRREKRREVEKTAKRVGARISKREGKRQKMRERDEVGDSFPLSHRDPTSRLCFLFLPSARRHGEGSKNLLRFSTCLREEDNLPSLWAFLLIEVSFSFFLVYGTTCPQAQERREKGRARSCSLFLCWTSESARSL